MANCSIYYLQLSKLQDERSSLQDQLRDYEDRINAMTSHFKNVKQELSFTQACNVGIHDMTMCSHGTFYIAFTSVILFYRYKGKL